MGAPETEGELWLRTGVRGRHAALGGPNKSKLCVSLRHGAETVQARRVPERTGYLVETLKVPWCSRSGSIHYIGEDEEPSLRRWLGELLWASTGHVLMWQLAPGRPRHVHSLGNESTCSST